MSSTTSPTTTTRTTSLPPPVSITLSLSPTQYTYGSPPPNLSIVVVSHASKPITLYRGFSILNPHYALMMRQFRITDLSTKQPVDQLAVNFKMREPSRNRGSPSEEGFITLLPEEQITISEPFAPKDFPPMAMNDPKRVGKLPGGATRSSQVLGVDGLEAGKEYALGVAEDATGCWWKWGTKDDVLVPPGKLVGLGDADGEMMKFDAGNIEEVNFSIQS